MARRLDQVLVIDVESTDDSDSEGAGLVYSISGGVDQALFVIDFDGVLSFLNPPDFENPLDNNGDNIYEVEVTVTDSGLLTDSQTIEVTVTSVSGIQASFDSFDGISVTSAMNW